MATKTSKYLLMTAMVMVAIGSISLATIATNADADDINKGIGKTDVWEPGPTDGGPEYIPDKLYDARNVVEYDNAYIATERNAVTDDQLKENFELMRESDIGIVSLAIDYEIGQLVLYAEDLTIDDKIQAIIGDFPYVLLYEEHVERGPPPAVDKDNPKLGTQSNSDPLLDILSSFLPKAYAVSDSAHGTHLDAEIGSSYTGAYARLEIHDSGVTIPTGVTVFGGNIMPNSESSMEIAIEYKPSTTKVRVYDHADGKFTTSKTVDPTFMSTYVTTVSGKDYIYVKVEELSGTWKAYMWNKNISAYEFLDSQPDDGPREDGWSVWEEYSLSGNCASATIPEINGDGVQVKHSGTWKLATSSHASEYDTTNDIPCYTENMDDDFYHWYVN